MNINTMIRVFNILADTPFFVGASDNGGMHWFVWGIVSSNDLNRREWPFFRWAIYDRALEEYYRAHRMLPNSKWVYP